MKNNREVNYFYKSCDLNSMDDKDKKRYEYLNDYGYNIDCGSKRIIDDEKNSYCIKRFVNNTYKSGKR